MPALSRIVLLSTLTALLQISLQPIAIGQEPNAAPPDSIDRDYSGELPRIPPRSPEEALKTFRTLDGFRVDLVAAEPLVADPVACAFDEFGRLFVVEMRDYSEDAEADLGRVRLLEDTDGDGRYDESHVYCDGLSWPTAIACWDGGVFVAAAPEIVYLKDADGDGVAERREVVFDGFARTNVQGLVNSLRWGLDGRLYGATSSSGAEVRSLRHPEAPALSLRRRDFSIDPVAMTLRPESGGGQHGMSFDEFGCRFASANSDHLQQIAYEDRYVARNPYLVAPPANVSIAADGPQAPVFRESPVEPWRIVRTRLRAGGIVPGIVEGGGQPAGYFTGATGVTIYTGDAFGHEFRDTAFVADVGSNLVHRKKLSEQGVLSVGRRVDEGREFLASTDIWFRPVDMANGPDGAFYVLDMSREVIEHPASLPPIIKKHLNLTSGRTQGRVYRVAPENFPPRAYPRLGDLPSAELVPLLAHANGWHRETAARLLLARRDASNVESIRELAKTAPEPEGRVRCLHLLATLDQLRASDLLPALQDPHPRVREAAVRLSESFAGSESADHVFEALLERADDEDARVRYQLAFTLGEFDRPERLDALTKIAKRDAGDRFVRTAIQSSLGHGAAEAFARLAGDADIRQVPGGQELLLALARQIGAQGPESTVASTLRKLGSEDERSAESSQRLVRALLEPAARDVRFAAKLRAACDAVALSAIDATLTDSERIAAETASDPNVRAEAIRLLALGSFDEARKSLGPLIDPAQPQVVQIASVATLSAFREPEATELLLDRFSSLSPNVRSEALEALLARPERIAALLDRIERKKFAASDVDSARRRRLSEHPESAIRTRAEKLFRESASADRAKVLSRYAAALDVAGDAERGRALFRKECAACHRLEGVGYEIGKDLKGIGARGAETILTNVLDPNREVDPAYLDYAVLTTDGRTLSGVVSAETATSVTLTRAGGTSETVLRSDIETMRASGVSIMPEGLERQIDVQAMADLLAYLRSLP